MTKADFAAVLPFVGMNCMQSPLVCSNLNEKSDIVFFDVFEIFVGAVLDVFASSLIANNDAVLVHLEHRDGPHLGHGAFDGSLEGARFVVTVAEDEHFFGTHHGADADGEGGGGHIVGIAAEEA